MPVLRVSVTVPVAPALFTALPLASAKVTVTSNPVPAVWFPIVATSNWLAAPACVVMLELVPVMLLVVAVTVVTVPATVCVVSVTVATPLPSVFDVPAENVPFESLLLQVTVCPEVATALLFASANCAVIVTALPATGVELEALTRYLLAAPGTDTVATAAVEVLLESSVAVMEKVRLPTVGVPAVFWYDRSRAIAWASDSVRFE